MAKAEPVGPWAAAGAPLASSPFTQDAPQRGSLGLPRAVPPCPPLPSPPPSGPADRRG
jgi:hypothetical protein